MNQIKKDFIVSSGSERGIMDETLVKFAAFIAKTNQSKKI